MPYEVINAIRAKSTIRITGNTATLITLSDFSAIPSEQVTNVSIAQISSTTDGVWRIYRGDDASGVLLLELPNSSNFVLYEYDISFANSSSSNVYITNSETAGTLIMQCSKTTKYTPPLEGL